MPFVTASCARQGMGAPSGPVFFPEKCRLLLIGMGLLEKGVNPPFTACKTAAAGEGRADLILGDKFLYGRDFCHFRGKGFTGKVQVFQVLPNLLWIVIVEPQHIPVLLVGGPKGGVFFRKVLTKLRAFQLAGKPLGFLREPAPSVLYNALQIPGFPGFIAEIVAEMPQFFRQPQPFISSGLGKLHIGGKLAGFQQLPDTLSGALPGNDLCGFIITGGFSTREMDSVLAIPDGEAACICGKSVAAMIEFFQSGGDLRDRLLLFKFSGHALPQTVRIAAQPQHMVNVCLGKRKSRGCFHILCFVYDSDLFRFGGEQV